MRFLRYSWRALPVALLFLVTSLPFFTSLIARLGQPQAVAPGAPREVDPLILPLAGPITGNPSEISGLAWYADHLILLPQYPKRMSLMGGGALFAIPRAEIDALIDGKSTRPITPVKVFLDSGGLEWRIKGFEGYEALAIQGDQVFVTIEAWSRKQMHSYLVRGKIEPDLSLITLDAIHAVEVPLDVQIRNFSNEALVIAGDRLLLIYEANGEGITTIPIARTYDFDLNPLPVQEMAHLEYRVTDATAVEAADSGGSFINGSCLSGISRPASATGGTFWVLNTFYPGDLFLMPLRDLLAERFGRGATHAQNLYVERLVELQLPATPNGPITLTGAPPIQLKLDDRKIPRNWEGITRLPGRGFLIVIDKFPSTLLAFVPEPE